MHNTSTGVQHTPHGSVRPASGPGSSAGVPSSGQAAPVPAPLRLRYGRITLALLGLVFIAGVLAGSIAALLGAVSGWLPAASAIGIAGVFGSLRSLAVRDRRNRQARRQAAARAAQREQAPAPRPANPRADAVFDGAGAETKAAPAAALPAETRPAAPAPKPIPRLTAQELRDAALAEAAKSAEASSWEPVAVPKPTYVDAPVAPRAAPQPLAAPASPKPVLKTPIRPVAAPVAGSTAIEPRPATGILNLDDVLQRRRA
ncbi:hypothetical protein [Arthrobacter sp. 7Tela_A1]|uniref:hypothetical protein n=1 Tax=Arthrobacter sp. 7Tela_A1 TaxID=3093745 RepID=UPI003BB519D3